MNEKPGTDDRSMSEILASIRKIVTDEEETRRTAGEGRREAETAGGAEVFVLTGDMKEDGPQAAEPLDLGASGPIDAAAGEVLDLGAPDANADDAAEPLELGAIERSADDALKEMNAGTVERFDLGAAMGVKPDPENDGSRPEPLVAEQVDEPAPVEVPPVEAPPVAAEPSPAEIVSTPVVEFPAVEGLSENDVEEIVRRIVREELKGPIGQQISRKVKSLIREEIAIALKSETDDGLI